jgi:hypothetical protein
MSRILEIVLFLTPFVGFAVWRFLLPSPLLPSWLVYGLAGFMVLTLTGLLWLWHVDASDANQPYVPAELRDGLVVPAHPAAPR